MNDTDTEDWLVPLAPIPDVSFDCPYCDVSLNSTGWYMPGMRVLATLECPTCDCEFYGDLPTGDAVNGQILLDSEDGSVHADRNDFFSKWLKESYANRCADSVDIGWDRRRELDHPTVLNCLDALYGHSLVMCLYAQHFVDETNIDLIVVVPENLEWLVPDEAAAVWAVDLPLDRGYEWNDWLAEQFAARLDEFDGVDICTVRPFPIDATVDIERFTGVEPFPLEEWAGRMDEPTVTFVWRDDRHWSPVPPAAITLDWLSEREPVGLSENPIIKTGAGVLDAVGRRVQRRRTITLGKRLRAAFPSVDFAVAGLGDSGGLPDWITDYRFSSPTPENERTLCRRYAASHIVVGVHGSNMLLPSAHAGAVVDLMPERRWGNMEQDLLVRHRESSETGFHYQSLPLKTGPGVVAQVTRAMLENGYKLF